MRSKHIFALATFFTSFVLSSLFVGLFFDTTAVDPELYEIVSVKTQAENSVSEKIILLLQTDEENGRLSDAEEFDLADVDNLFSPLRVELITVSAYAAKSDSLNTAGLPPDFQVAWRAHMKAWSNYSNFLGKAEDAGMDIETVKRFKKQYDVDIESTWFEVLRVASKYGADFSG